MLIQIVCESTTYCDYSIVRPSISVKTEPERFLCWTSVSNNFKHISTKVSTGMTIINTQRKSNKYPTFFHFNLIDIEVITMFSIPTSSYAIHSWTNEASNESDNCSNVGPVLDSPFTAQDHFSHNELAEVNVSLAWSYMDHRCLHIWIILCQLLSFTCSSMTSWWWAIDIACTILATSSGLDHKVSKISPLTSLAPSTKFNKIFRKHSVMFPTRCHFPMASIISKESYDSKNSDSDTHCQKWMLYWQQM